MENPDHIQNLIAEMQSNQLQNQIDAVKALSNAAFNNFAVQNTIREANGLSALLNLIAYPASELRDEIIWALYVLIENNAASKAALRDMNAISRLEALINPNDPVLSANIRGLIRELQEAHVIHAAPASQNSAASVPNQPNM